MNRKLIILLIILLSTFFVLVVKKTKSDFEGKAQRSFHVEVDASSGATKQWNKQKYFENIQVTKKEKVAIIYPFEGAVFPADFSPASFVWKEFEASKSEWKVVFKADDYIYEEKSKKNSFKPSVELWERLKKESKNQVIQFSISNKSEQRLLNFRFSKDSVAAPIFYRAVPLPFSYANKYRANLKWYLGDVSQNQKRLMLDEMPVCANCHSFTSNGSSFGMDVDYANDKGNYTISKVEKESTIALNDIFSWGDYKREDGVQTYALLTKLSPDGKFAISTVKDKSIFVPVDKDFWYSQLFFPVKGILAAYDTQEKRFFELEGASDSNFVQSSVAWSPNMKEIMFSRAPYNKDTLLDASKNAVIDMQFAEDYVNKSKDFKFDLYKLPWNDGRGGKPEPIKGASNDGNSNYFARYSPDGKWVVFCKAENFMLLQPDSKLYIMPAEGGTPRLMNCNTNEMNSWHSFSPNSKWMVFSTKYFGPYTQLFLTHIDENGNDTPPIWLEQLTIDMKAANIPEFVNVDYNDWQGIKEGFTDSSKYQNTVINYNYRVGDLDAIIEYADNIIKNEPNNPKGYYLKAKTLIDKGRKEQALGYANKAIRAFETLKNKSVNDYVDLGQTYDLLGNSDVAIEYVNKALTFEPENIDAWVALSGIYYNNKDYNNTVHAFTKLFEITGQVDYLLERADLKIRARRLYNEAISDLKMVLEADNCSAAALEMLSECYKNLGNLKAAENTISRMVSCDPTQGVSYFARGNFYMDNRNYKKALADFSEGLKYEKSDALAYYYRGLIYVELKRFKEALKDAEKAKQLTIEQYKKGQSVYSAQKIEQLIQTCKIELKK